MAGIFGLDFGTTNSLAAIIRGGQAVTLVNEEDDLPHPSVVWYRGAEPVVGRVAKRHLAEAATGVFGDAVRSPKAYLGSGAPIHVGGVSRPASDVVAEILRFLRNDALRRKFEGEAFDRGIVTIPVAMPGRARRELRDAALKAGIQVLQFVHEPLAGLYGYLRSLGDHRRHLAELEGQIALVFDWGGGTLDLTLCQFLGGILVQVANKGDMQVGGDRFDDALVRYVRNKHAEHHGINVWPPDAPGGAARLLDQCEQAKIALSGRGSFGILVRNFLATDGPEKDLEVTLSRDELVNQTRDIVFRGLKNIDSILDSVGLREPSVAICLATGGMVNMPFVRERLIERFGTARLANISNGERVIAEGAAWIAHDRLRLRLAKSLELLHAGNSYMPVLNQGMILPQQGEEHTVRPLGMYCVDPRDGVAKFQFARPRLPRHTMASDDRLIYSIMTLQVDSTAAPLLERLELSLRVNEDLVVGIRGRSSLRGDVAETEIHDLEFGLGTPFADDGTQDGSGGPIENSEGGSIKFGEKTPSTVRLRSNVTPKTEAWELVPGEIVERYKPLILDTRHHPNSRQVAERMYYQPCALCGRFSRDIALNGCNDPSCREANRSVRSR